MLGRNVRQQGVFDTAALLILFRTLYKKVWTHGAMPRAERPGPETRGAKLTGVPDKTVIRLSPGGSALI